MSYRKFSSTLFYNSEVQKHFLFLIHDHIERYSKCKSSTSINEMNNKKTLMYSIEVSYIYITAECITENLHQNYITTAS